MNIALLCLLTWGSWTAEPSGSIGEPVEILHSSRENSGQGTNRSSAGFPAFEIEGQEIRWQGEAVSLSLKNADLREVLRSLARLSGTNLVLHPEVRGQVTLELKEVPWDQALDVILRSQGLGGVWEGSVLRVEAR